MPWKLNEKNRVIASMQRLYQDAQKLEVKLRIKHPQEDADRLWESNRRLGSEIDSLIGRVMDEWGLEADAVADSLNQAAEDFKSAAEDIAKKVEIAQKIVKASSHLDQATDSIRKLLGSLL